MKCRNLIELMAALTATVVLSGFANASTPQPTADVQRQGSGELAIARQAWLECIRAAIPALDVPPATSDAVARAATKSCAEKYSAIVQALSRTVAPSCAQDSGCTRAALAKAEREATQTAVNEVTAERIRVANAQVLKCQ